MNLDKERDTFEQGAEVDLNRYRYDKPLDSYVHKHNGAVCERVTNQYKGWMLRAAYHAHTSMLPPRTFVGCRACFGSGGKRNLPCQVCNGTGKLPRGTPQ